MNELVFYLFYIAIGITVSRSFAVIFARAEGDRTPGEAVLAKLPILASRSVGDLQDTFYACVLVLQERVFGRRATLASLVHMSLWAAFVAVLLLMAVTAIVDFNTAGAG